ncbi:MAG: VOC family protein [Rhodospirillales bacterium]|nr:VOC family protein [Rhodospirillales bacterium]
MPVLNFGQPIDGVVQVAYTVEDIETSARAWSQQFGIGPWFVRGPFTPASALYRGKPTAISISLAIAFSGHLQVELIQQHNDAPSLYREVIERRGFGFHHWGTASDRFDQRVEQFRRRGHDIAFFDVTPAGTRVAYFDTTRELSGMIEVIEMNDAQERRYTRMYTEALNWDGRDLIRRVG